MENTMIIGEDTTSILIKKTEKGYYLDLTKNVMVSTLEGLTAGTDIVKPEEVLLQFQFVGGKVELQLPDFMTVVVEDCYGNRFVVASDKDRMITNIYSEDDSTKTPVEEVEIDVFNGLLMIIAGVSDTDPTIPKTTQLH